MVAVTNLKDNLGSYHKNDFGHITATTLILPKGEIISVELPEINFST